MTTTAHPDIDLDQLVDLDATVPCLLAADYPNPATWHVTVIHPDDTRCTSTTSCDTHHHTAKAAQARADAHAAILACKAHRNPGCRLDWRPL